MAAWRWWRVSVIPTFGLKKERAEGLRTDVRVWRTFCLVLVVVIEDNDMKPDQKKEETDD
jgi:hypothetical protein